MLQDTEHCQGMVKHEALYWETVFSFCHKLGL